MAGHTAAAPLRAALATAALVGLGTAVLALPASAQTTVPRPSSFTSTSTVQATAGEVAADADGDSTASAAFVLELNSDLDVLCYSITTRGVEPPYSSPARTSTHLHEGPAGRSGPPRVVFVDPTSGTDSAPRTSAGCLQGPFTTGVTADGGDTGSGFTVAELEADPTAYYVDIHTEGFPGGSLRGQLPASGTTTAAAPAPAAPAPAAPAPAAPAAAAPAPAAPAPAAAAPVGGVAAGFGGLAGDDVPPATAGLAAALLALTAGLTGTTVLRGRRRAQG